MVQIQIGKREVFRDLSQRHKLTESGVAVFRELDQEVPRPAACSVGAASKPFDAPRNRRQVLLVFFLSFLRSPASQQKALFFGRYDHDADTHLASPRGVFAIPVEPHKSHAVHIVPGLLQRIRISRDSLTIQVLGRFPERLEAVGDVSGFNGKMH